MRQLQLTVSCFWCTEGCRFYGNSSRNPRLEALTSLDASHSACGGKQCFCLKLLKLELAFWKSITEKSCKTHQGTHEVWCSSMQDIQSGEAASITSPAKPPSKLTHMNGCPRTFFRGHGKTRTQVSQGFKHDPKISESLNSKPR